jgi:hypothetical protein
MVHASPHAPLPLPNAGDCAAVQDNYVLDQIRAKDLIVLQNYPQPVVHPPQKPAPPWTTTPHAPHGRAHRLAPVSSAAASEPASFTQRQLIGGPCPCQSALLKNVRSFGMWKLCAAKSSNDGQSMLHSGGEQAGPAGWDRQALLAFLNQQLSSHLVPMPGSCSAGGAARGAAQRGGGIPAAVPGCAGAAAHI